MTLLLFGVLGKFCRATIGDHVSARRVYLAIGLGGHAEDHEAEQAKLRKATDRNALPSSYRYTSSQELNPKGPNHQQSHQQTSTED
jgi:hypothetical protein